MADSVWTIARTKTILITCAIGNTRSATSHLTYGKYYLLFVPRTLWLARSSRNSARDGSQIHAASLTRTRTPYSLKNSLIPMGDTRIGRTGKKYLVVSNGEKNATPNPPFVIASSTPWEAVQKKK